MAAQAKPVVKVRKSVTEEVRRLNAEGGLRAPIRIGAVALPLSDLDEASALRILAGVAKQANAITDPTDWIRKLAETWSRKPPEAPRRPIPEPIIIEPEPPRRAIPQPTIVEPGRGVLGFRDAMPRADKREQSLLVPKSKPQARTPTPPSFAPPTQARLPTPPSFAPPRSIRAQVPPSFAPSVSASRTPSSGSAMMALPARPSSAAPRSGVPYNAFAPRGNATSSLAAMAAQGSIANSLDAAAPRGSIASSLRAAVPRGSIGNSLRAPMPNVDRSRTPPVARTPPVVLDRSTPATPSAPRFHHACPTGKSNSGGLPILEHRAALVEAMCGNIPICCIQGETGCGKSTQIPQIIRQEALRMGQPCCVAVTQPRRVAALNLANRVASELGEEQLGEAVGYRIGGESRPGREIDFCTTGYLLQLLINAPREIERYTHIVLDEVHDRTADSDMLCLVVRLLVQATFDASPSGNCVRLVIMSATLQSSLFANYFAPLSELVGVYQQPPTVFVGTRCFPVQEYYLEDLQQAFRINHGWDINRRVKEEAKCDKKGGARVDPRHTEKLHNIIVDLLRVVGRRGCTILVFLPGIAEISALWEDARCLETDGSFHVLLLHSMIPREEQEEVFKEPLPGVTNVVLATDIAESSITLPHVTAVLDFGLHRRIDYDDKRGMACLATKWVSQAAAKQRSGRAGRTQPGICIRLYSRHLHDVCFQPHEPPESASMPLDRLYLQAKQLAECLSSSLGDRSPKCAQDVLLQMIQAPNISKIAAARTTLAELGAITTPEESAAITPLGRLCLQLPLDLRLTRLVWMGSLWGNPADAVVLAACLGSAEPFSSPSPMFIKNEKDFVNRLYRSVSCRLLFDGGLHSEPLMLRQLFLEWLVRFQESEGSRAARIEGQIAQAQQHSVEQFSHEFALARGRMGHLVSTVTDITLRTLRTCQQDGEIFASLQGLINCMGYSFNARGDLSKLNFDEWRTTDVWRVFDAKTPVLKSLLASAFSDHLMLGGYLGTMARSSEKDKGKAKSKAEKILGEMDANGMPRDRTIVFVKPGDKFDPDQYVSFVCGSRSRLRLNRKSLQDSGVDSLKESELVEVPSGIDSSKQQLSSRFDQSSEMGLPMQFNLLHQFALSMKDVQRSAPRANEYQDWTYGAYEVDHPHALHWELMVPFGKGPRVAMPDRRNALGFMARLPDSSSGNDLPPIATIGVAATIQGTGAANKCFVLGATELPASYIGFILATGKCDGILNMTTGGAISLLHHFVAFPKEVLNSKYWELVSRLRNALREEMERVDDQYDDPNVRMPLFADSVLRDCVWDLLDESEENAHKVAQKIFPLQGNPENPQARIVSLLESQHVGTDGRIYALQPLAKWEDLEERKRQATIRKPEVKKKGAATDVQNVPTVPLSASAADLDKYIQNLPPGGVVGHPALLHEVTLLETKFGLQKGDKRRITEATRGQEKIKKRKKAMKTFRTPDLLWCKNNNGGDKVQLPVDQYGKSYVFTACLLDSINYLEDLAKVRQMKPGEERDDGQIFGPPPTDVAPSSLPPPEKVKKSKEKTTTEKLWLLCEHVGNSRGFVEIATLSGHGSRLVSVLEGASSNKSLSKNQQKRLRAFLHRVRSLQKASTPKVPTKGLVKGEDHVVDTIIKLEQLLEKSIDPPPMSQPSSSTSASGVKRCLEQNGGGAQVDLSKLQYSCPRCKDSFPSWTECREHMISAGHGLTESTILMQSTGEEKKSKRERKRERKALLAASGLSKKERRKLTKAEREAGPPRYACPACGELFKTWGECLSHFKLTDHPKRKQKVCAQEAQQILRRTQPNTSGAQSVNSGATMSGHQDVSATPAASQKMNSDSETSEDEDGDQSNEDQQDRTEEAGDATMSVHNTMVAEADQDGQDIAPGSKRWARHGLTEGEEEGWMTPDEEDQETSFVESASMIDYSKMNEEEQLVAAMRLSLQEENEDAVDAAEDAEDLDEADDDEDCDEDNGDDEEGNAPGIEDQEADDNDVLDDPYGDDAVAMDCFDDPLVL